MFGALRMNVLCMYMTILYAYILIWFMSEVRYLISPFEQLNSHPRSIKIHMHLIKRPYFINLINHTDTKNKLIYRIIKFVAVLIWYWIIYYDNAIIQSQFILWSVMKILHCRSTAPSTDPIWPIKCTFHRLKWGGNIR